MPFSKIYFTNSFITAARRMCSNFFAPEQAIMAVIKKNELLLWITVANLIPY